MKSFNNLINAVNPSDGIDVLIENGDIVVFKKGSKQKITSWGHNFSPILSPDKEHIAFLSESKASLENPNRSQPYQGPYLNLWIIDISGNNPIQVLKHDDDINPDNLHWLDNTNLLFTHGAESVKVFSLKSKQIRTILGFEEAESFCYDACGYEIKFIFNKSNTHLMRLAGGHPPVKIGIVDLKTLKSFELTDDYEFSLDDVEFSKDDKVMSFSGYKTYDRERKLLEVQVDLYNQKVYEEPLE